MASLKRILIGIPLLILFVYVFQVVMSAMDISLNSYFNYLSFIIIICIFIMILPLPGDKSDIFA